MNSRLTSDTFPILIDYKSRKTWDPSWPTSVPFDFIAPHESQAARNHGQTLRRLAARGGLGPSEMQAVLADRPWRSMTDAEAVALIMKHLEIWERGE